MQFLFRIDPLTQFKNLAQGPRFGVTWRYKKGDETSPDKTLFKHENVLYWASNKGTSGGRGGDQTRLNMAINKDYNATVAFPKKGDPKKTGEKLTRLKAELAQKATQAPA